MSMQIDLRGLHGLMPKPQRDHRTIDTSLEQLHRSRVPEYVGRDALLSQRGAPSASGFDVLAKHILNRIGTQATAMHVGEKCDGVVGRRFLEPALQGRHERLRQRRAALFAAFADTTHMRTDAECNGPPIKPCQLRQPKAGLDRKRQQCMIATSKPRGSIGRVQKRFDLQAVQEMDDLLSSRLLGIASTRWMCALYAGSSKAANRKKDRIAVRRRLRVRALAAALGL